MALQKWQIKTREDIGRVLGYMTQTLMDKWVEGPYQVTIEPYVYTRSLNQNALYWKWMGVIVEWMRKNKPYVVVDGVKQKSLPDKNDEAKESISFMMQKMFLGTHTPKVGKWTGDEQIVSTRSLSTGEMYEYMEKVDAWWSDKGVVLPTPQDSEFFLNRQKNG